MRLRTLLLLGAALAAGCKTPSVEDLFRPVQTEMRKLADSVVTGAGEALATDPTKARLHAAVDDWTATARDNLIGAGARADLARIETDVRFAVGALFDSAQARLTAMRNDLLGPETRVRAAMLRDDLLGVETALRTARIAAAVRDTLLGETTAARASALRDTLIGARTRSSIALLLGQALDTVRVHTRQEEKALSGTATWILIVAGAVIAVLLFLASRFFMAKKKQERMLGVLAHQIENVRDPDVAKEIKSGVRQQAVAAGVEPALREFLGRMGY